MAKPEQKPGILRNLTIKRVSLVENGANQDTVTRDGAHIMLFKAGPSLAAVHVDAPLGKCGPDCVGCSKCDPDGLKKLSKEKPVAKTIASVFKSMVAAIMEPDETKRTELLKTIEKDAEMAMAAPPGAPPPPPAAGNPNAAHLATLKAMIDSHGPGPHPEGHPVHALKAACDALGPASTEPPSGADEPGKLGAGPLAKAHVEKMEALEKSNKELVTSLAIEKGIRLDGEMREVLKSFTATPFILEGENSDVAKFRKMKEENPEGWARTFELLKATDAQIAQSRLFGKHIGTGLTGTGTAWDQISSKAEALVEKSTNGLTREQAVEKVMLDNPKLVEQYRAEQQ